MDKFAEAYTKIISETNENNNLPEFAKTPSSLYKALGIEKCYVKAYSGKRGRIYDIEKTPITEDTYFYNTIVKEILKNNIKTPDQIKVIDVTKFSTKNSEAIRDSMRHESEFSYEEGIGCTLKINNKAFKFGLIF